MDRLLGIKKDDLTNCYVKEGIMPLLTMLKEEHEVNHKPFTVLVCDIDHFKSFNDEYGHLLGDEIIKYFSSSLRLDLDGLENYPFRFGGDEFVVVFPGRESEEVAPLVERLRENIKTRQCLIQGNQIRMSFSGGIATFPVNASEIEDLLEKADKAMYFSKKHGRARFTEYGRMKQVNRQLLLKQFATLGLALFVLVSTVFRKDIQFALERLFMEVQVPRIAQETNVYISEAVKEVKKKLPASVVGSDPEPVADAVPKLKDAIIRLKTGGFIEGTIVEEVEADGEVWVKLRPKIGRASMMIKKSDIGEIE